MQSVTKQQKRKHSVSYNKTSYFSRQILPITIRQIFPYKYNNSFWQQISFVSPKLFLQQQKEIKKQLFNNTKHFDKYFRKFYQNHKCIYHWTLLAIQKHSQIKQYIFQSLIKISFQEHLQQYKLIHANKKMRTFYMPSVSKPKNNCNQQNKNKQRYEKSNKKQKYINQTSILKNISQSQHSSFQKMHKYQECPKHYILKSIIKVGFQQPNKNKQNKYQIQIGKDQNYHDLFVKTYDACDGAKYTVYDYQKHMKGSQERECYNKFIRNKSKQYSLHKNTIRKKTENKQNLNEKQFHVKNRQIPINIYQYSPKNEQQKQQQDKLNSSFEYKAYGQTKNSFLNKKLNISISSYQSFSKIIKNKTFKINQYPFSLKKIYFKKISMI